jgi:DNA polymerase
VTDVAEHLLLHLETAARMYGGDLLLPVALLPVAPRPAIAPAVRAAAPAPPPARAIPAAPPPRPAPERITAPVAAATAAPVHAAPSDTIAAGGSLADLRTEVLACRRCKLCEQRKTVVFGEGNPTPPVLFVGEAPGAVEDRTGRPFVGPAGQLLDRILENAMGLRREDVFIANVNKCRPPGNRDPEPEEVAACLPYLRRQVELLRPRVIVALGRIAAHNLLGTQQPMRALRGRDLAYEGIPVVVTWHPAFLLRDPSHKRETWEDIKRVNRLLGRPDVPDAGGPGS